MCLFAFVVLGWIAPIHAQSEMTEQRLEQIRFEGTPNVNGYTVFFPVQRSICKVEVDMCAPEVLAQTEKWGREWASYSRKSYSGWASQMFTTLRGQKKFLPLFDRIADELLRESQTWGLDSVEVATSFVQSYPYVRGEWEKYPAESIANHYGDCSDMSVILQRLLHGMGIRSDLFLYQHFKHATIGIPLEDKGKDTPYAFVECTNYLPIGRISLDDIGRGFSYEDSIKYDPGHPSAKSPLKLEFKQRQADLYPGFLGLKAEHRALDRVLGMNYLTQDMRGRLEKELEVASGSKYPSKEGVAHLESLLKAEDRLVGAQTILKAHQDSLLAMVGDFEDAKCLRGGNERKCLVLASNLEAVHGMLPVLNMGVQAAEMEFDVYRIQWNNWIARDPWFLE
jgi:hypothetical protein